MKWCRPEFYDRFRCIAGACRDSCCIGWEIDVDDDKKEYYRQVTGELGERLNVSINWDEGHFILQGKEERCPFLNRENLCDLILGLGEDSLCDICREHPRFYDWYDGYTEAGLGLCCEEAARLLLESEQKLTFAADDYEDKEAWINTLFDARETAYRILQNREYSIWKRLHTFLVYIEELQQCIDFESLDETEETVFYYRENLNMEYGDMELQDIEHQDMEHACQRKPAYEMLLEICKKLEPMDENWPDMINRLRELVQNEEQLRRAEEMLDGRYGHLEHHYEHLAVYFVYRYFMKSREDSNIRSKGMLVIFFVLLIRLLDLWEIFTGNSITAECRAWNAKRCSKEIEYSEENLEILDQLFWEMDAEAFYSIF